MVDLFFPGKMKRRWVNKKEYLKKINRYGYLVKKLEKKNVSEMLAGGGVCCMSDVCVCVSAFNTHSSTCLVRV